jgi:two-component system, sensor histidine kinase and response regulator
MTTVLLVDDDPRMQVLGRKVLERHGYRVVVAADGIEAATAAERERFDVVLMDLEMPRVNGHDAMRLLKARQPTLPVVAVTAYAMAGDSERCRAEGFDDYISKPYEIKQLRSLVARLAGDH